MMERKLGFDRATLSDKVKEETDAVLTMSAVIARELVQDYPEGKAYKPAEELEKAAWTADGRWVATMEHPDTGLITRRSDVKGKVVNVQFRKDITDPKTKRPNVRGLSADITWYKDKVPKQMLDDVKSGVLKDVSIGFTYDQDDTPGTFEGQHYDFAQRNIFIDHVVAPCPMGRCPSPYCGIGVDSILIEQKIGADPAEDCPICRAIEEIGVKEAGKRLGAKYGSDVVDVIREDANSDKAKQIERLKTHGIAPKPGVGHVTKPKEFSNIPDNEFADPVNYKYPIDAAHVEAAWNYINHPDNQKAGGYSDKEWALMKTRIKAAMKKHGHQVADEGDPGDKPEEKKPEEKTKEQKPRDDEPTVEQLLSRTEELLSMMKRLNTKPSAL